VQERGSLAAAGASSPGSGHVLGAPPPLRGGVPTDALRTNCLDRVQSVNPGRLVCLSEDRVFSRVLFPGPALSSRRRPGRAYSRAFPGFGSAADVRPAWRSPRNGEWERRDPVPTCLLICGASHLAHYAALRSLPGCPRDPTGSPFELVAATVWVLRSVFGAGS
jgi:hypothetical protein